MVFLNKIISFLKEQYDKLLCFLVLLILLGSLVYLAVRMGMFHQMEEEHDARIDKLRPLFESAIAVDVGVMQETLEKTRNPIEISAWTNYVFVPEKRVWCVDCRGPISYKAMVCPFCTAKQPRPVESSWSRDVDSDGIPDLWEIHYELDPNDPADAHKDSDGDGFINIVEFNAQPGTVPSLDPEAPPGTMQGTNLRDPADGPPYEAELQVSKVEADPFNLLFKSTIKTRDTSLMFGINTREKNPQTRFVKMGGEVEGFKVVDFEPKLEERMDLSVSSRPIKVDVSILKLKRGDKIIALTKGKKVEYSEFSAELFFNLDDSRYIVKVGSEFDLKKTGKKYRVLSIDGERSIVVIKRLADGEMLTIRRPSVVSSGDGGRSVIVIEGASSGYEE